MPRRRRSRTVPFSRVSAQAGALAGALVLVLAGCGRIYELPPPEGEPVVLGTEVLVATWTDADDGTLTLLRDGTFRADRVCVAVGYEEGLAWSGTGTWRRGANTEQTVVALDFDADHPEEDGRRIDSYAALRHDGVLKLWTAVGDPDHDMPHCVLTRPAPAA
ncbi:hypothetical protein [Streptomyces termitum]|uniref:hypothetical protein n=1 Tax=Streptomyces termitum TaxID=67368 RepID=UPI0033B97838